MDDKTIDAATFLSAQNHLSSDQFRLLVEAVKDYGIFMLDPSGKVSSWNPGAEKIEGYEAAEIVGEHFDRFYTAEDIEAGMPQQGLRIALEDERFEEEGVRLRKGGMAFPAIVTITNIRDSFGQHVGFAVVMRDITERKRSEAALLEKESELAEVIRLARMGYWCRNLTTGEVRWSDKLHEIFGTTPSECAPSCEAFLAIVHPDDRRAVDERIGRAMAESGIFDHTYRILVGSDVRTIHEVGRVIPSANGQLRRIVGNVRDVSEHKNAEDAIRASEERFRAFMDNSPAAAFIKDESGRYLYVNPTWSKQFGTESIEWQGKTDFDFWPQETAEIFRASDTACLAIDEVVEREETAMTADGRNATWLTMKFPLVEGDRRRVGGMAWEITARKRAEESVMLSEARYHRLFDAAQDGILIIDAISRRIIDANPYLMNLIDYSWDELVGKELWEVGLFQDIESNKAAFQKLQNEKFIRYDDLPLLTKRGRRIAVEFVSNMYDVGDIRVIQCNIRDMTDRKRAEVDLLLRDRAIASLVHGLCITDSTLPDNPIIYINRSFTRLTGYEREEAIGRNCRFLQGPESSPEAIERVRSAIRQEKPCMVEMLNYRRDGSKFWNALSISPIRDRAGRVTNLVGVQTDISPLKLMERQFHQSQKMEAVGQLAGGVAHDFNNLLTIISGYSEIVLETLAEDDRNREAIEAIRHAGDRAAGLTRQLLFFSRRALLEMRVVELNGVVEDAEKLLRRTIGADIVFATRLDPEIGRVRVDPGQIGQVLMNLAINARDAMPHGGKLTIETANVVLDETYAAEHPDCRPGRHVMLAVSDTGSGMTPQVRDRAFEPFFSTKGPGKGTGLGLATVYGIVKQCNGSICLYSEPDCGTTFKIYLPIVDDPLQPVGDRNTAKATGGVETILLVEDEDAVRTIARLILHGQGYTVLEADSGQHALEIVDQHRGRIDLLVTDLVMPGMNGRDLAETLCDRFPGLRVLYQSGYTEDSAVRHGILMSQVAFLQKPYTPLSLAIKVRAVLDR